MGYNVMVENQNGTDCSTSSNNTAAGYLALLGSVFNPYIMTGTGDSAFGAWALYGNATGSYNTATGAYALYTNYYGSNNTAAGFWALYGNTTGVGNTASGYYALAGNSTGSRNNATGEGALASNDANDNNAMGVNALTDNTSGTLNNAMGNYALEYNTTGNNNNAVGYGSLLRNTTGSDNSGQGYFSLEGNTTGNLNIGVGYKAGSSLTTGSNNIDIGNVGVAAESARIRIGTQGTQSATFIAAIAGTNITGGAAVVVSSSGQLGVVSSSQRYKEDIEPMGDVSDRLYDLRPVTFRYRQPDAEGQKPVQVGLIAEEVAGVLPELVVYNSDGQPESVAYHLLPTLLLNELQKEHRQIEQQQLELKQARELIQVQSQQLSELMGQAATVKAMAARLAELERSMTEMAAGRVEPAIIVAATQ
jgi:Chaperone of endosialidase